MKNSPRWLVATAFLLSLSACGQSYRWRYSTGKKIFAPGTHKYIGKVVQYDAEHDFGNSLPRQPSVLIEEAPVPPNTVGERVWYGCFYLEEYESE